MNRNVIDVDKIRIKQTDTWKTTNYKIYWKPVFFEIHHDNINMDRLPRDTLQNTIDNIYPSVIRYFLVHTRTKHDKYFV